MLMQELMAVGQPRPALDEHERLTRAHRRAGLVYQASVAMQQLVASLRGGLSLVHGRSAGDSHNAGDVLLEALHSYRWDAYLFAPDEEDPHPEFAVESIRIAYQAIHLPEILRVACFAAESDDALRRLTMNHGYWFRWLVDPALDPADETVFATEALLVDGRPVECASVEPLELDGGHGVVRLFHLPEPEGHGLHGVDVLARSRLYTGSDRRIHVEAVAPRPVTDAEFRLTVSRGMAARKITVSTAQVTPLTGEGAPVSGPLFTRSGKEMGAVARFAYPLQQGSGVTFEIERDAAASAAFLSARAATS
jgi:hypothetical protein